MEPAAIISPETKPLTAAYFLRALPYTQED
jgi:hypothetical protein